MDFNSIFPIFVEQQTFNTMGKGDKKSRRGKINSGSYGKKRPRKASRSIVASEEKTKK
ncbi:hypothetical protein CRH01_20750 [Chryseobacterium rhizosphaerae]|nr:hypothetical protein CRH01_20750 [Chryseobacterium rhizosphaerae]